MNARSLVVCRLACVLAIVGPALPLSAQAPAGTDRPLIALYEPSGQKADSTLTAALSTVADSVELDLACLQRFEVKRLTAVDPAKDMAKVRSYCQANRIDQAILGSGSAKPAGGYAFRLMLYDRRTDSVTLVQEGSSSGALDMFDTTDVLVAALLDKLSGTHLLFGSLTVQTEPPGAVVSLNGKEVGPSPLSLRGLPVGTVNITARSAGWEDGSSTATVQDNQITDTTLALARSEGTLTLDMPRDATVKLRAAGIPERILRGPTSEQIPTASYELEAACPGLSTVRQSLSVARNATASFRPWAGAYLEVSSDVAEAAVAVDGVPKGMAPLLLEVDPGVLHQVELSKEKYQAYRADLSVAAARKVSFSPQLTLKPGSIRVESTPSGAYVRLDDGRMGNAPCVFEGVVPGAHTIHAWNRLVNGRMYVVVPTTAVDVSSEEQSLVTLLLRPGTGKLELTGIPREAEVRVGEEVWHPGMSVPAGSLDVVVSIPSGQTWKGTVSVSDGQVANVPLESLAAMIPRRTIKVDGKVDDWDGLVPLWGGVRESWSRYWFAAATPGQDPFPNQPGTMLNSAYICQDDANIYIRMDFDDGLPSLNLTKDIKDKLAREVHFFLPNGKMLNAQTSYHRRWGLDSSVGEWDQNTRTWTPLGTLTAFVAAGSTLELAIPRSRIQKYLAGGPLEVEISIADPGEQNWNKGYSTYRRSLDFQK